jgi:hypothetical protein
MKLPITISLSRDSGSRPAACGMCTIICGAKFFCRRSFAYRDGLAPVCTVVFIEPSETKSVELRFPSFAPQQMVNQAK